MATFTMTDSQQVDCTLSYLDKRGNPTNPPPGAVTPVWSVDLPTVCSVAPSADGNTCTVMAIGPLGTAVVSVKVSDTNGNPLAAGSVEFNIISGAPATVTITPGTPTEQP